MSSSDNENGVPPGQTPAPASVASPTDRVSAADPMAAPAARRNAVSRWLAAGLVIAVVVIVALAATLRHQQQQLDNFGRESTRRLDTVVAAAEAARSQAAQAAGQATAHESRLSGLDQRLLRLEEEQRTLAQSYRELMSGNDEAMLVELEQSLMLAAEQLQWAGRVPSAIAALQMADARLARAGRTAFVPLRQAIGRDLNRLQALPAVNMSDVSARIERLMREVDALPLAAVGAQVESADAPAEPRDESAEQGGQPAETAPADAAWWERAWVPVRDWSRRVREATFEELQTLVHVRRLDNPEALLLAPEQAAWLRTNVRLRLAEARIALLSREAELWRTDLDAARDAVRRYADPEAPQTRAMLRSLDQLAEIDPAPRLPELTDSLAAVRSLLAQAGPDGGDTAAAPAPGGAPAAESPASQSASGSNGQPASQPAPPQNGQQQNGQQQNGQQQNGQPQQRDAPATPAPASAPAQPVPAPANGG